MPDNYGYPLIWEIWDLNQVASRSATNPKQPNDPKEQSRPYLVIADPMGRATATCCSIQEALQPSTYLTEVNLSNGYQGKITKNCVIKCHEIYTIEKKYFTKYICNLDPTDINKVGDALYEFLKI